MSNVRRGQTKNTNFKRVKQMQVQVCGQNGGDWYSTQQWLLIDHRGDTELLMEIPEWIAKHAGIEPEPDQPVTVYYAHAKRHEEFADGSGTVFHRKVNRSAEELGTFVNQLYQAYAKTIKFTVKTPMIQVSYDVNYWYDDDQGERHRLDTDRHSYFSDHKQVRIALQLERYIMTANKDLYQPSTWDDWESGALALHSKFHPSDKEALAEREKLIPYTDDMWSKLTQLKLALCGIGDKLHELLNRPGAELAQMIESGALKLPMIEDQRKGSQDE